MTVDSGRPSARGGAPATRAVARWAVRLFLREWRQQALILTLVLVAVATTVIGAGVAFNTPLPANEGFGNARDSLDFQASSQRIAAVIAAVEKQVGTVDVIEDQTVSVPGSVDTYQLRAEPPRGRYDSPMVDLLSGSFPAAPNQADVTPAVASELHLHRGSTWRAGGRTWTDVGTVQNPQSLLDEFALVEPGQVATPTEVDLLFDATAAQLSQLPATVAGQVVTLSEAESFNQGVLTPQTIVLAVSMLGFLLIALVSVGGFTVLAQRRLRAIGLLASLGATDRQVRSTVRANGVAVGLTGTALGSIVGFLVWAGYRPTLEQSSHHDFSMWHLPWTDVVIGLVVAVVATTFAASRPARAVARVPVVAALTGRPPDPRPLHRTAVPGLVCGGVGLVLVGAAAAARGGGSSAIPLLLGLVFLATTLILLAPFLLTAVDHALRRAPFPVRMAARNLARYRARSGATLAAIALSVMIAVIVCVTAAARYGDVLDYVGPNLANNQLIVYTNIPMGGEYINPNGQIVKVPSPSAATVAKDIRTQTAVDHKIAAALGVTADLALYETSASLVHNAAGRQFNGQLYVATPAMLAAFHITPRDYAADADVLTMRPGLNTIGNLQLQFGGNNGGGQIINPGPGNLGPNICPPTSCVVPVISEVGALPSGTSAPNTVLTEYAVRTLHLSTTLNGWLLVLPHNLTRSQIDGARSLAAESHLSIETKSSAPTASEINGWATIVGSLLALAILAMSLGLLRAETASDLRTYAAAGATGYTRRTLAATTAGALALLGALAGTVVGYLTDVAFFKGSQFDSLSELSNIPLKNLFVLVVLFPAGAALLGWVFSARAPRNLNQRPIE